ncbi:MAG: lipid II:glycine glycyltransferase FemX [Parvularcula sp.]
MSAITFSKSSASAEAAVPIEDQSLRATWNQIDRTAWTRHLAATPFSAYQQDYAYGRWLQSIGATVHRVLVEDQHGPVALAQVQFRKFFGLATLGMILMGPVWLRRDLSTQTKANALAELSRSAPLPRRAALLVMPADADQGPFAALRSPCVVSSYHTALLDISADLATVRAGFHGKWRNRLSAAERSGLSARTLPRDPNAWQWLLEKERAQRKRARYAGMPVEMIPAFQREAGARSVMVLAAELDGVAVAGCLFIRHGASATYHIGWSGPDGKEHSAHNLLLWKAIENLQGQGVRTLDLGGLVGEASVGLARFKLGTGATPLSQAGTFLLRPRWR